VSWNIAVRASGSIASLPWLMAFGAAGAGAFRAAPQDGVHPCDQFARTEGFFT